MAYAFGVILFALCIGLSLGLHEAGHLLTAKAFGMKVRRFFVGYGPKLFSFRRGGTEYGLKAVPLGGFCDIAGMTTLDELTPDEESRAMYRQKAWKRTVVMATGPVSHFLLGFLVLYVMSVTMGLPNTQEKPTIDSVAGCVVDDGQNCAPGQLGPAEAAGIRSGDTVLSVAGKSTPTWADMVTAVRASAGPTPVEVRRGDSTLRFTVDIPRVERKGAGRVGAIGATPAAALAYGPIEAFGATTSYTGQLFAQTWEKLIRFPERVPALVNAIMGGERDPDTPVSVVGASRIGGEAVQAGLWSTFILMVAGLNLFLGVFNLLPLLPMDGGHIAIIFYERIRDWIRKLRGREAAGPVDFSRLATVTLVLVVIGGAFVLLTITADIVNPVRIT
ncbi:M50 family metallopeptidase [Actinocrispum wychmicini]|uniref:RIP metalloprotease RseP n=1 Tax=Actinocrispum wychmicini TaxID=1213861 RepID=A0A4R2J2E8_9PSEU|nr:M50 family metallopeptidase [Actinocrispum wychmicini]TCO52413.1 RIP metalloprotease RseP [Actinocrispum wychmicini]